MAKPFPYVTASEAADMLDVSLMEISRMVRKGKIKGSFKFGFMWALPRKEVQKIKREKEIKANGQ
jgi:excisionase family DNA binding protein